MQINRDGAYNRASISIGENYAFLGTACTNMHLKSIDYQLWVAIKEVPFISLKFVDGLFSKKLPKECNDEEIKKVSYDLKAINISISSLSLNVYFSISHFMTAKAMWDTLQFLHEGTKNVKALGGYLEIMFFCLEGC